MRHMCPYVLGSGRSTLGVIGVLLTMLMFAPVELRGQQLSFDVSQFNAAQPADPSVSVRVISPYATVTKGMRWPVAIVLDIPQGWHLYANPRQGELGIDTEVVLPERPDVSMGRPKYPVGVFYEDKALDTSNYIYEGKVHILLAMELQGAQKESLEVVLPLKGLLCSDAGQCVPWEETALFEVGVGGAVEAANLTQEEQDVFEGFNVDDAFGVAPDALGSPAEAQSSSGGPQNALMAILLAVAAGLLMNLMPCVWPVIPIIVMTLVQHSRPEEDQAEPAAQNKPLKLGLVFAGGILVVFVGLALLMSVFKLLYGQQFQSHIFKFILLMVVYVLGLSMFGLFEITLPASVSNMNTVKKGYLGTFLMGMLATVLATPCGAPLLGGVLTYSLSQPLPITIAMFIIVGVGMAAPYVVLTAFPGLLNRVPRAGNWMIRLKQALAFMMMGFSVYLIGLFPPAWHAPIAMFCVIVGFCVWLGMHVVGFGTPAGKKWLVRALALAILLLGGQYIHSSLPEAQHEASAQHWSGQLEENLAAGKTVFLKFTANWCKNCKYLDKTVIQTERFQAQLEQANAVLVVADWSDPDPQIDAMLQRFNTKAIPFSVVFPAGRQDEPITLSGLYSLDKAVSVLQQARQAGSDMPQQE